uniref:Uncharacterized protein n=1 Tax=Oryza glumipatula TaxID=40148 RepID=A0A0D9YM60_9ORYZ
MWGRGGLTLTRSGVYCSFRPTAAATGDGCATGDRPRVSYTFFSISGEYPLIGWQLLVVVAAIYI